MANPPSAEPSDFAMKNLCKVWDAGIPVAMGDADPLIDVMNLSRVYRVIKGGSVFDPDEPIRSIR